MNNQNQLLLQSIFDDIIKRILNYLIPDEKQQDKWYDNEEITFDKDRWSILFKGDWDRQMYLYGHINLDEYNRKETISKIVSRLY